MTVIGINGSPRKHGNTATLVEHALAGATATGAHTEIIHLYDLDYKGCTSCFACKTPGRISGRCAMEDGLALVLDKIRDADALVLGTPLYFGAATGEMRSFLERLLFPFLSWDDGTSLFGRETPVGLIVTMGVTERRMEEFGYGPHLARMEHFLKLIFGQCEAMYVTDTLHVDDYEQYRMKQFDAREKMQRHRDVFPVDCEKASRLGSRLCRNITVPR